MHVPECNGRLGLAALQRLQHHSLRYRINAILRLVGTAKHLEDSAAEAL